MISSKYIVLLFNRLDVEGVEGAFDLVEAFGGDVGVDFGGAGGFVAEEGLDVAEVGAGFEEVGGEAVAEGVDGDALFDLGFLESVFEDGLDAAVGIGLAGLAFEEVFLGFVLLDVAAEEVEGFGGEKGVAVFFAFGLGDADLHAFGVYVGLFQGDGFADAEAGGVDGGEDGAVFEVGWGGEDELNFVLAEDDGEGFFGAGAIDKVDFALAAKDAFVVEFDGVDGLVLVGYGDFAFGHEVAEEGDDLVFVNPGDFEAVVEVDEFFEEAGVGLDGVGAVA